MPQFNTHAHAPIKLDARYDRRVIEHVAILEGGDHLEAGVLGKLAEILGELLQSSLLRWCGAAKDTFK